LRSSPLEWWRAWCAFGESLFRLSLGITLGDAERIRGLARLIEREPTATGPRRTFDVLCYKPRIFEDNEIIRDEAIPFGTGRTQSMSRVA